jgi:hypothetical protein
VGATIGSPQVSVTTAPPAGAGPVSVAAPVTVWPPSTVVAPSEMPRRATLAGGGVTVLLVTVKVAVAEALSVAVMTAVPAATAVIVKAAVVVPALTATLPGTTATPVALLVRATVDPPVGAAVESVTVPVALPPATTLAGLSDTLETDTVGVGVGVGAGLGVELLH